MTNESIHEVLSGIVGPTIPAPAGYDPHSTLDLQQILGGLLIDWLNHADQQGPTDTFSMRESDYPKEGCWRCDGWRAGVKIVHQLFAEDRWITVDLGDGSWPLTDYRWRVFPDQFLLEIEKRLRFALGQFREADRLNFHGATGALECCVNAIRRVRQEQTCRHLWGPERSRRYCGDEPPEPDYRKCDLCGVERDVEE